MHASSCTGLQLIWQAIQTAVLARQCCSKQQNAAAHTAHCLACPMQQSRPQLCKLDCSPGLCCAIAHKLDNNIQCYQSCAPLLMAMLHMYQCDLLSVREWLNCAARAWSSLLKLCGNNRQAQTNEMQPAKWCMIVDAGAFQNGCNTMLPCWVSSLLFKAQCNQLCNVTPNRGASFSSQKAEKAFYEKHPELAEMHIKPPLLLEVNALNQKFVELQGQTMQNSFPQVMAKVRSLSIA